MKRIACLFVTLMLGAACFGQTATKDAAQNPGFPRVVARVNLYNRTHNINPQTLFTPSQPGLFRMSGIINNTVGNGDFEGEWTAYMSWANEVGSNNSQVIGAVGTEIPECGFGGNPVIFNASKDTPIAVSVVGTNNTSGSQYNAYIILEQLE